MFLEWSLKAVTNYALFIGILSSLYLLPIEIKYFGTQPFYI